MGLPLGRIMEEVEHELLHMHELADEVVDNMELADEVDDNMENELDGITLEVVDGNKEVLKGHDVWRCEDFRSYKIVTTKEEGKANPKL